MTIKLMTCCGKLEFGMTAYRDSVPDNEHFATLMQDARAVVVARVGDGL